MGLLPKIGDPLTKLWGGVADNISLNPLSVLRTYTHVSLCCPPWVLCWHIRICKNSWYYSWYMSWYYLWENLHKIGSDKDILMNVFCLLAVLQRNPLESKQKTLQQLSILRIIPPSDEKKGKNTAEVAVVVGRTNDHNWFNFSTFITFIVLGWVVNINCDISINIKINILFYNRHII